MHPIPSQPFEAFGDMPDIPPLPEARLPGLLDEDDTRVLAQAR